MKHLIHLLCIPLLLTACQSQEMPDDVMATNRNATRALNDFTLTPLAVDLDHTIIVKK